MNEIKNPEKQIEKQPVQQTPERLRSLEARKSQRDLGDDSASVTERLNPKSNIEHKTDANSRVKDPNETPKVRRDSEDNFNSQGKETVEKQPVEKYENYRDFSTKQREIGRDASLTKEQKVDAIQKEFPKIEDKTDINIPSDAKYVDSFTKAGDIRYDWPKYMGFETKKDSIKSISRENPMPNQWDRYGHMGGNNFSSIPESGKYTYSERAIPYVENDAAYHKGSFNNETYFDKIDAIKNKDLDSLNGILAKKGIPQIDSDDFEMITDSYDRYLTNTKTELGDKVDATYGLSGTAASWGDMSGGAEQYVTPLKGNQMKQLGMLQEEKE